MFLFYLRCVQRSCPCRRCVFRIPLFCFRGFVLARVFPKREDHLVGVLYQCYLLARRVVNFSSFVLWRLDMQTVVWHLRLVTVCSPP